MGGYDPFWYLTTYVGYGCPMEPSLLVAEVSDRVLESGSKVVPLVGFLLGGPGSRVGSTE